MNTFTICGHAASGCNYPEGECPEPAPVLVEYRMRCGLTVTRGTPAGEVRWKHEGNGGDVVAYRRK